MDKKIKEICDVIVSNYRRAREDFRFDGDYINHFAAILYGTMEKDIPIDTVKKIRTYIKDSTSRMSSFRGDILYMLSFLISMTDNSRIFTEVVLETYDELVEAGFKESPHLVFSAYALVQHGETIKNSKYIMDMKEIYDDMKKNYNEIINEEDYLECTLLALNKVNKDIVNNYMKNIFNTLTNFEEFSRNSIQGLTLALLLNKNKSSFIRVQQLLLEFKNKDIKVSHQFLPLIAISAGSYIAEEYSEKIIEISDYLCGEEYEYEYYMDASFRTFIAISILEYCDNNSKKFLNELLAMGVYSFLVSKNQGIMSKVLA